MMTQFVCGERRTRGGAAWLCQVALSTGLAAILAIDAFGQEGGDLSISGAVEAVAPGRITLKTPANDTWALMVPRDANVEVTGTAEPDLLQRGAFVRLLATVDRRGQVRGPVQQLTLTEVANRPGRRPGVFRPGQFEPPAPGDQKDDVGFVMPGMQPLIPEGAEEAMLELRGHIRNYRRGFLTLEVPHPLFRGPLRVELKELPTIALEFSDYSHARPGDRVSAKGPQVGPNVIRAKEVSLELNTPVGDPRKRPAPAPDARPLRPEERQPFGAAPEPEPEAKPEPRVPEVPEEPEVPAEADHRPEPPDPDAAPIGQQPVEAPPHEPPPAAERDDEDELLAMVTPEPGTTVPPAIRVRLGEARPVTFAPSRPIPATDIRRQFGAPDQVFDVRGELPVGRERGLQEVRWEMWVYGRAKLLIDETGMVRYRQAR